MFKDEAIKFLPVVDEYGRLVNLITKAQMHSLLLQDIRQVQLDDSRIPLACGSSVFIPKGCRHRLTNTDEKENLIITEVQIGEDFGEDDIIRYEDKYGRI